MHTYIHEHISYFHTYYTYLHTYHTCKLSSIHIILPYIHTILCIHIILTYIRTYKNTNRSFIHTYYTMHTYYTYISYLHHAYVSQSLSESCVFVSHGRCPSNLQHSRVACTLDAARATLYICVCVCRVRSYTSAECAELTLNTREPASTRYDLGCVQTL